MANPRWKFTPESPFLALAARYIALCLEGVANYPEDAWHRYRNSDVKFAEL
jgi:hypothetical protein